MENEKKEVVFTEGMIFKKPREGAPDYVKGSMSFKVDEFTAFLKKHNNNGWVNVDLKVSKAGKLYTQLNDWKPKEEVAQVSPEQAQKNFEEMTKNVNTDAETIEYPDDVASPDEIPF
jgi:hypothetical protein